MGHDVFPHLERALFELREAPPLREPKGAVEIFALDLDG
jgi:hypothetical protein